MEIVNKIRDTFNVRRIKSGIPYTILAKNDSTEQAQVFIYKHSKVRYTVVDFKDSIPTAYNGRKPIRTELKTASGMIKSSLSEAVEEQGLSSYLTFKMADDIYAWTIDFSRLQKGDKFKLIYAEDAVHEEAFEDMAELTAKFPNTLVTGDDLTVTSKDILTKAIKVKACNAAILKVNQAGSLYDALEFANVANQNNVKLITSHRSGESTDSQISHIGIATGSKMLKVGVVGGERIAKLNELLRLSGHDFICGMAEI